MISNIPKNENEVWELRAPGLDMVDVDEIGDRILERLEKEREQQKMLQRLKMEEDLEKIGKNVAEDRADGVSGDGKVSKDQDIITSPDVNNAR